jgi:outer membrane receptor protein involved in Fe transport
MSKRSLSCLARRPIALACCLITACAFRLSAHGQQAPSEPAPASSAADSSAEKNGDQVYQLSPFKVSTDKDRGYRATNSTSGTRLNSAIKDLPMPIEVITEQFIKDTASADLRQSLRYSSGILLQTQNDYGTTMNSAYSNPGKLNNPEAQTASPDMTHMKIRGFQTQAVLRDGFRRQNATDSVNISRIEVARGPASLLYGVGNFGGVVNYLQKLPQHKEAGEVSFAYGNYDYMRSTIDVTGPLGEKAAYRVTGAWQSRNDYTEYNKESHYFVSPVFSWKPFENTEVTLDTEFGKSSENGIGWRNLRAALSLYVNQADGYNGSFLKIPGKNLRTVRWSGPDTYRDSTAYNVELKVDQKITEDLHLLAGVNRSVFNWDQLDNMAAFKRDISGVPAWAIAPVTFQGLTDAQSGVPLGPRPTTIVYQWENFKQDNTHDQLRVELNYAHISFEHSKWLRMENSLLAGLSYTREEMFDHTRQTARDTVNYHSPSDFNVFRYGKQPNGDADAPMVENTNRQTITHDPAYYAVYQGKFLDGRVTLVGGGRKDRSWNRQWIYSPEFNSDGTRHGDDEPRTSKSTTSKDTTYQYGVSVSITKELSAYAMHSEGVEPNYNGYLDFNGKPLLAALGENDEVGLKFDLLEGRISGTISKFHITRSRAQVGGGDSVWFAPVVKDKLNFDPKKDIVYRINELNPHDDGNSWNPVTLAVAPQWDAAVAAGKVYQATNSQGQTHWYVNCGSVTNVGGAGAALMDATFAKAYELKAFDYFGWFYDGADPGAMPFDNLVNNATMDDNGAGYSAATGTDEAYGWDGQLLFQPTQNLQVAFSWSHIVKRVVKAAEWAKYPYPQDRWTIWYMPVSWAATAGRPLSEVYTDPTDTSTFKSFGDGMTMDDTPRDQGTVWINYQFDKNSPLKGFSFGLGGEYESERIIYPAWGQTALDADGNSITLATPKRYVYNGMAKYDFKFRGHDASVQLNVENIPNDTAQYGFVYSTPRKWQLMFDYKF